MKETMRKVMAVMLSAVMAMTLMVSNVVKAAEPKGSIKLTTSSQPLNGRDFAAYQLFNLKVGAGEKYAYTEVNPTITTAVATSLETAVTEYNKVSDADLTFTKVGATAKSIVKFLEDNKNNAKFLNYFANALEGNKASLGKAYTSVQGGEAPLYSATISDLPYGYYVVVETTTVDPETKDTALSIAMLDNVYNTETELKVKSELPTVDKTIQKDDQKVKGNDYNIGDTVKFNLDGTTPSKAILDTYTKYEYTFHDTLSQGLTVEDIASLNMTFEVNGKPAGYVVTEDGTITSNGKAIGKVTLTQPNLEDSTTKLDVTFTDLKDAEIYEKFNADGKNKITVKYDAVLNKKADLGTNGELNTVYIEYSNKPFTEETGNSTESKVHVYTFGLDITKVDATNKTALTGAVFELYKDAECSTPVNVKEIKLGEYVVDKNGTNTVKVDAQGKLVVKGLDAGTYYLKETVAPDGYNLLEKPVKVEITTVIDPVTGELTSFSYTVGDSELTQGTLTDGLVKGSVENNSGELLPETGGMGTTMLYIVGILAMACGLGYFALNKKRASSK